MKEPDLVAFVAWPKIGRVHAWLNYFACAVKGDEFFIQVESGCPSWGDGEPFLLHRTCYEESPQHEHDALFRSGARTSNRKGGKMFANTIPEDWKRLISSAKDGIHKVTGCVKLCVHCREFILPERQKDPIFDFWAIPHDFRVWPHDGVTACQVSEFVSTEISPLRQQLPFSFSLCCRCSNEFKWRLKKGENVDRPDVPVKVMRRAETRIKQSCKRKGISIYGTTRRVASAYRVFTDGYGYGFADTAQKWRQQDQAELKARHVKRRKAEPNFFAMVDAVGKLGKIQKEN
jgi:hypothetical protein